MTDTRLTAERLTELESLLSRSTTDVSWEARAESAVAVAKRLLAEVAAKDAKLAAMLDEYKAADEERLQETNDAHEEANKWKAEGDMYGWNFHEGRAGGITWGSIIFYRVRRKLEAILSDAPSQPTEVEFIPLGEYRVSKCGDGLHLSGPGLNAALGMGQLARIINGYAENPEVFTESERLRGVLKEIRKVVDEYTGDDEPDFGFIKAILSKENI